MFERSSFAAIVLAAVLGATVTAERMCGMMRSIPTLRVNGSEDTLAALDLTLPRDLGPARKLR